MRFPAVAACGLLVLAACGGPADDESEPAPAVAAKMPIEEPEEVGATPTASANGVHQVDCRITNDYGARYEGSCIFTPDRGGSFSLARPGGGALIDSVTDVSLQLTGEGVGEIRGLTTEGINSRWGAVTRSEDDRACWTGSDFEICAW